MCLPNEPIQPIAEVFGEKPKELLKAANLLGGTKLALGDAAFEIISLKGIPLTYILCGKEGFQLPQTYYMMLQHVAVSTLRLMEASKKSLSYYLNPIAPRKNKRNKLV